MAVALEEIEAQSFVKSAQSDAFSRGEVSKKVSDNFFKEFYFLSTTNTLFINSFPELGTTKMVYTLKAS